MFANYNLNQQQPQPQQQQAQMTSNNQAQQQHQHQQQSQQLQQQKLAESHDMSSLSMQRQPWFAMSPMFHRRPYSGVDNLILAAMYEESAAIAAANMHDTSANQQQHQHQHLQHPNNNNNNNTSQLPISSGYLPSGRGLGFFGLRDPAMEAPTPTNKSELELYRLLERANLLSYFGTFINFGGDDVQQISDADDDEFLEIMELVGMNQKPLHVRRLQKALADWRDAKEAESCFKRPLNSYNQHKEQNPNPYNQQQQNQSNHLDQMRRATSPDPSILVSPATTPNSVKSMIVMTPDSKRLMAAGEKPTTPQHQPYSSPHEILIGAPKRPRLMDNIGVVLGNAARDKLAESSKSSEEEKQQNERQPSETQSQSEANPTDETAKKQRSQ